MGSVPFCGISFDPPPVTAVHLVAALEMPIGKIVSVPFSSIVSLMKFLKSELRSALETSFRCRRKASREITRYRDKMSAPQDILPRPLGLSWPEAARPTRRRSHLESRLQRPMPP